MSKKMCPNGFYTFENEGADVLPRPAGMSSAIKRGIDEVKGYTPPVFKENKTGCYVEFYAYHPVKGRMVRKRIKINRVKGVANRRMYASDLIMRVSGQLIQGWNPWIEKDTENLDIFENALARYEAFVEKMFAQGCFRKETYAGYKSNIKILRFYVAKVSPIVYLYQFDRKFCSAFLDYVFIERENCAQTRNNYLNFLRVLSGFFVDKGLLKSRPTDGISPISRRLFAKQRKCIPLDVVSKIGEWCRENDPHFLLACQLLYYCFVRPVEMTRLKVRDFNLQKGVIVLPGDITKNRKTQHVTVPAAVLHHAVDLGIFSAPMDSLVFSVGLKPGDRAIDPKIFRDHWERVRQALKLRDEWKFYSLKDTGITAMCDRKVAPVTVKDQARHSSLEVTELYLNHDREAAREILELRGEL